MARYIAVAHNVESGEIKQFGRPYPTPTQAYDEVLRDLLDIDEPFEGYVEVLLVPKGMNPTDPDVMSTGKQVKKGVVSVE